ncbi:MAG: DUF2277 domain-containing protein [Chloroflexota bacterium]
MCRNIKQLYNFDPPATDDEIREASLQFVRKVTGMRKPSQVNEAIFNQAVEDMTALISGLFDELETSASPKNREEEARKAKERSHKRFGG